MTEIVHTTTMDATDDELYVAVAHDRATGRTLVALDERAATALRLIAGHLVANYTEVLDGSYGFLDEDAPDVANAAELLYSLLPRT